ncbi:MAG: S41 family peptidase [Chitinispirillia bacterium]|jgi:carboxyl-terminal processing protease
MDKYKNHGPLHFIILLIIPLFIICISDLGDSYYYDSIYDIELNYCKKVIRDYLILQDSFPEGFDTITSPDLLLRSINEPYTYYVQPEKADSVWNMYIQGNKETGIGITIDTLNSKFVITDVVPNSHAYNIIFINDIITGINNNMKIAEFSLDSMKNYLTGIENDSITLHIIRNSNSLDITILYKKYKKRSVNIKRITENPYLNIAYIQIESFSDSTCITGGTKSEFREALIQTNWANYTILDLRGNKGGNIDQCMSVISNLIPVSKKLFYISQRVNDTLTGTVQTVDSLWRVKEYSTLGQNRKFFVLMDNNSMGETELLIYSLHLYRDDIITIGKRSRGKARIQTHFATVKGGIAVVTTGLVTPFSGSSFDNVGINPKIVSSHPLEAAIILMEGN